MASLLDPEPWWCHQMETFSALLAICAGNSPVPGEFPTQSPVTRSFDVFFDLRPNKRLSKQSWGWWFETPSCPLWRHCNAWSESVPITVNFVEASVWDSVRCSVPDVLIRVQCVGIMCDSRIISMWHCWNYTTSQRKFKYQDDNFYLCSGRFLRVDWVVHDDVVKWKHFPRY